MMELFSVVKICTDECTYSFAETVGVFSTEVKANDAILELLIKHENDLFKNEYQVDKIYLDQLFEI